MIGQREGQNSYVKIKIIKQKWIRLMVNGLDYPTANGVPRLFGTAKMDGTGDPDSSSN